MKKKTKTKKVVNQPFFNEGDEDEAERQATIVRSELPAPKTQKVERVAGSKPIPLPTIVHHHYHNHHYHDNDDGFPDKPEAESDQPMHPSDHTQDGEILKDERTKIPVKEIRKIVSEHPNTDSIRITSQGKNAPVAEIEESEKFDKKDLVSNLDSFEKKTDTLNDLAGDIRKAAADQKVRIDEKLQGKIDKFRFLRE